MTGLQKLVAKARANTCQMLLRDVLTAAGVLSLVILEIWHRTFVDDMCLPLRALREAYPGPEALRA